MKCPNPVCVFGIAPSGAPFGSAVEGSFKRPKADEIGRRRRNSIRMTGRMSWLFFLGASLVIELLLL